MLLIVAVLVSVLYVVYSYPGYKDRVPNGGIISHPCFPGTVWDGLGHELVRGRGVRNPFGRDFEANGNVSNYRLSMKLREGNVFTDVCHYVQGERVTSHGIGQMVRYPPDIRHEVSPLPLDIRSGVSPSPCYWHLVVTTRESLAPATDIWWSSQQNCSNVFTWGPNPHWNWNLVAATEAGGTHPTGMLSCTLNVCLNVQHTLWD